MSFFHIIFYSIYLIILLRLLYLLINSKYKEAFVVLLLYVFAILAFNQLINIYYLYIVEPILEFFNTGQA